MLSQDYYTTATFGNANATNEYLLLKILVNTVVIGNYTATPTNQIVPGILANATVNGQAVSLLGYFDGSMNTSNVGGAPAAVNYLDAGGAAPLTMNLVKCYMIIPCSFTVCRRMTFMYPNVQRSVIQMHQKCSCPAVREYSELCTLLAASGTDGPVIILT